MVLINMDGNDKLLRSAARSQDDEEALIKREAEKILTSDKVWSKLVNTIFNKSVYTEYFFCKYHVF